ncbi:hypothetical protein [Streptomyces sp. NBC_01304]|uniref:hypothetical protein n=1 Tax=Streptomyces sp. NBC_01304 TaxID=2903818 RepID=UPI002E0D6B88|nr:hypothetical protein OG430_00830 [Streptomyces sp. NBC_01304]
MSHLDPEDAVGKQAAVLEFSDDLRGADVRPLQAFLAARFGELAENQIEGTDAHWTAAHLAQVIDTYCRDLDDDLVTWEVTVRERRIQEPGLVQMLRQSIATDWNRLVDTASRWAGHPDHLSRWRRLRYSSVEHAEFVEQVLGDATDAGTFYDQA